jgi:endonuclease YncB( thermonuclease family)
VEIDAPEMNQPFGAQSKNFLNRLLYEKDVTLISQGEDRYGRVLGNLFSNELNVNMLMVKFGFAWVYDKYAKNSSLYEYQDQAKAENLGLVASLKIQLRLGCGANKNELNCSDAYFSGEAFIQIARKHSDQMVG